MGRRRYSWEHLNGKDYIGRRRYSRLRDYTERRRYSSDCLSLRDFAGTRRHSFAGQTTQKGCVILETVWGGRTTHEGGVILGAARAGDTTLRRYSWHCISWKDYIGIRRYFLESRSRRDCIGQRWCSWDCLNICMNVVCCVTRMLPPFSHAPDWTMWWTIYWLTLCFPSRIILFPLPSLILEKIVLGLCVRIPLLSTGIQENHELLCKDRGRFQNLFFRIHIPFSVLSFWHEKNSKKTNYEVLCACMSIRPWLVKMVFSVSAFWRNVLLRYFGKLKIWNDNLWKSGLPLCINNVWSSYLLYFSEQLTRSC